MFSTSIRGNGAPGVKSVLRGARGIDARVYYKGDRSLSPEVGGVGMRLKIAAASLVPVFMYWGEFGLVLDVVLAVTKKR